MKHTTHHGYRGYGGYHGHLRHPRPQHHQHHHRQQGPRGLSLLELMVGLTVGLLVLAGATGWAGQVLGLQQRAQREWQLQLELRALAAHLQLELRRAGSHGRPSSLVWRQEAAAQANAWATVSLSDGGRQVLLHRATDDDPEASGNSTGTGFRLADGRLDQLLGGRFQPLTDPAWMRITEFTVTLDTRAHPWAANCGRAVESRAATIELAAEAVGDPGLRRQLALTVHLRNDAIDGSCA